MRVAAPGKLLLTGAYAVLEGAPAIVVAVDRLAMADTERRADAPSREVELAFGADAAPHVDADSLFASGTTPSGSTKCLKLGLGSSAAMLVAALATRRAQSGADLASGAVRRELFAEAQAVHAASQGGGSGVDIAASVYGGALCYSLSGDSLSGDPLPASIEPVELPPGLHLAAFFSGTSARTSDLRRAVDALRLRDPMVYRECMDVLRAGAVLASRSLATRMLHIFLSAAEITRRALLKLGVAAGAPIVPSRFVKLGECAARGRAVFLPSGAGGGDVGVFLGSEAPSARFEQLAARLGFTRVPLAIDPTGVRLVDPEPYGSDALPDTRRCAS